MPRERREIRLPQLAPPMTVRQRFAAVGRRWRQLLRLAAATAAAFAFSTHVLGHEQAFFAPVAAVIVLLAGVGLRQRLLLELILGVAVGVLVGELLILAIGRGVWQIALIVVLTFSAAVFMGLKGVSLTQAANSGVLLAAVVPAVGADNPAMTRFLDALVGGACGLLAVLLIPRNATRDIDLQVRPLLEQLERVLDQVARALRTGEPEHAERALGTASGLQDQVNSAVSTAAAVREVAAMSPVRWYQRAEVARYAQALSDVDNAIRDARVLARRVASMLRLGEPGASLAPAVERLARGVRVFESGLSDPADHERAQDDLVDSVRIAVESLTDEMTLNRAAVAAQVRSLAADILFASGMTRDELDVRLNF